MSLLTERLLKASHEEDCCCEECCCEEQKENLSEEEIERIINEKYSEKDEKTKEFIRRFLLRWGDKFDFSKTHYINAKEKIIVICKIHGEFLISPNNIYSRGACPICGKEAGVKKQTGNTEEFIKRARITHGDKYDYSKVKYINAKTPVLIICPVHGEFLQTPDAHLRGQGCPRCSKYNNIVTSEIFIEKSRLVHGDKYDYSKVKYINSDTPVIIICPIHGEFLQTPHHHLSGYGCKLCGRIIAAEARKLTREEFIRRAKDIHGDKYDYSKVKYINSKTPVVITCPIHGDFLQTPENHLRGEGCKYCTTNVKLTTDIFIERANLIHGEGTYGYDKVNYINGRTPVKIYDPIYDEYFYQIAELHLRGHGNPNRRMSSGERLVYTWLKSKNISFNSEVLLKETLGRNGNGIRVDFVLSELPFIIEYNGGQHYRFTTKFHETLEDFNNQVKRDEELRNYCKQNLINLVEVPYTLKTIMDVSDFLTKTIIEGIDPHMLIDYNALYVVEDDNST